MKRNVAAVIAAVFVCALLFTACAGQRLSVDVATAEIIHERAILLFNETVQIIATVVHEQRPFHDFEVDRLKSIRSEAESLHQRLVTAAQVDDDLLTTVSLLQTILGSVVQ